MRRKTVRRVGDHYQATEAGMALLDLLTSSAEHLLATVLVDELDAGKFTKARRRLQGCEVAWRRC